MGNDSFKSDLMELYQGEIIGEVLFDRMLDYFDNPQHKYKVALMLQLETETKARLRSAMVALGVDLRETDEARQAGADMAAGLAGKSWNETMELLREGLKPYLERYQEIANSAPAEYRDVADSMVVHEQSLYEFVNKELAGDTDTSADAITAQLAFALPSP